jgi:hypothetical protein
MKGKTMKRMMIVCVLAVCLSGCAVLKAFKADVKDDKGNPVPTVQIDTNGDQVADAIALDTNADGVPDLDANGAPVIDAEASEALVKWQVANKAANVGIDAGAVTGDLLLFGGIPVLTLLAGVVKLWASNRGKEKLNQNLVASVQAGRMALGNLESIGTVPQGTLGKVDSAIRAVQDVATVVAVAELKGRAVTPSASSAAVPVTK